jgi:hypothetical protein
MSRRDFASEDDDATSHLEKRGTTFPPASAYTNDQFYPHQDTGIDVLHNRGILGEGIKVSRATSYVYVKTATETRRRTRARRLW